MDAEFLPFGVLGRPHGVAGAIILRPYNPGGWQLESVRLPMGVVLVTAGRETEATLATVRKRPDGYLVTLTGISSREQVAQHTGALVHIQRSALPALGPREFYVEDLLGCQAEDVEGRLRGTVRELFWNGAQDVMIIRGEHGEDALVPVVPEFVLALDRVSKRVLVDFHD